jgi:agmatinase
LHLRPASTFFGAPVGDIEDLQLGSIAAIGVYCDHFCAGNPGGRFGARQIRYASTVSGARLFDSNYAAELVDVGDFNVFPLEPERTFTIVMAQAQKIAHTGAKLFALGGDYSVSPAIVEGVTLALRSNDIGVLRISRRLDVLPAAPRSGRLPWRDGASGQLATLIKNGLEAVALLGGRGDVTLEENARAKAASVVPAHELAQTPARSVQAVRSKLERTAKLFYLSVDVDVLAPRLGSVALMTRHGGLSMAQLQAVLTELKGMAFVGAELTGHVPDLDVPGRALTQDITIIGTSILGLLKMEAQPCR